MLFLHPGSPVSVPDVAAAEQLAAAVLDYGEYGSPRQAAERLDAHGRRPRRAPVPAGHRARARARRRGAARCATPSGYAEAVDELVGAHLARRDEQRTADLLTGLGSDSLARAWTPTDDGPPVRAGLAWFTPTERLLAALPPPDRADVVVVVDAAGVGVDRALLGAAAPRLLAVAAPGTRAGGTTLLSLLYRASALVIRGRSTERPGRVVPLAALPRCAPSALREAL